MDRHDRRHGGQRDYRYPASRDWDRVLYSEAFRRLAQVTQVVGTSEVHVFHNRLTHSLKVAQVGERLGQYLHQNADPDALDAADGLDPEVLATAGLAHDLGHPPFGHVGESELQAVIDDDLPDSFEGNAQSFRIVTKLAWRSEREDEPALNLTRASLAAVLKYPWLHGDHPPDANPKKWGAYLSERHDFEFAREGLTSDEPAVEATLMDWADDITYAVHDIEDFYRAGLVPLQRLATDEVESRAFVSYAAAKLAEKQGKDLDPDLAAEAFETLRRYLPSRPFTGTRDDVESLHAFASTLITRYFDAVELLDNGQVHLRPRRNHEVAMLKEITWYYVIDSPALATLQQGQRRIINELYRRLRKWVRAAATDHREKRRLPIYLRELLTAVRTDGEALSAYAEDDDKLQARAVVDYIASLTEEQALELHRRLTGNPETSAFDVWLRSQ